MPDITTTFTNGIEAHLNVAAPVAAALAAWLLYGVIGSRYLGADDDFWPRLRRVALPALSKLAAGTPGLTATTTASKAEYAGYFEVRRDSLDTTWAIDAVERDLEAAGYRRNPLAAFKRNPQGWKSDGSWARRYGYIRGVGDLVRATGKNAGQVPLDPRWLGEMVGRFLQSLGDILAMRQVHATVFHEQTQDGKVVRVHVHVHDELNSLNPVVALGHYRGTTQSADRGIQAFQDDITPVTSSTRGGVSFVPAT